MSEYFLFHNYFC